MTDHLGWLFYDKNFMPHGYCFMWQPGTLWLNVGSDALIAASYFAIPAALYYFVRHRRAEIPYVWVPLMFAAFILLCGTTHAMEILTVWNPQYRLAGALKLLTGLVSFATVVTLVRIMPRVLLLQTPRQLQVQVAARTAELAQLNAQLQAEVAARTAAQDELRLAAVRKDEFLATLAHELRNPLAPIRHAARLLDAAGTDVQKRQWGTQVISRQLQRMTLLLDDLMDISRITRSQLELKLERISLGTLISTAVETATPLIEDKTHTLTVQIPEAARMVQVDPLRLSQAVANLLSNAAKYTPAGGHIELSAAADAAGLTISVKDNGRGFEPQALSAMFEMFGAVAPSHEREGGLGIGLALVKQLIQLHGGTVEARSAGPGKGSEFTIRIPGAWVGDQAGATALSSAGTSPVAGQGHSLLVVDDNRDSADALALLLKAAGYETTVGYSGKDALQLAARTQPGAIILDIGMPDLTGYEVARRLRQQPWGRAVFLVAMTGWGQAKDKELAREAGFDRHFTKPLDAAALQLQLAQYFESAALGREGSASPTS